MARYALGLYEKAMPGTMTIGDKLECAKECGYDYVELSVDETDREISINEVEELDTVTRTVKERG